MEQRTFWFLAYDPCCPYHNHSLPCACSPYYNFQNETFLGFIMNLETEMGVNLLTHPTFGEEVRHCVLPPGREQGAGMRKRNQGGWAGRAVSHLWFVLKGTGKYIGLAVHKPVTRPVVTRYCPFG